MRVIELNNAAEALSKATTCRQGRSTARVHRGEQRQHPFAQAARDVVLPVDAEATVSCARQEMKLEAGLRREYLAAVASIPYGFSFE